MHLRKRGRTYHYQAVVDGRTYSGNTHESDIRRARRFADEALRPILQAQTIEDLIELRRQHLAQSQPVLLADAWQSYAAQPGIAKSRRFRETAARWQRWLDWITARGKAKVADVTSADARTYASQLDDLSPATVKDHIGTCRQVFAAVMAEAGLPANPFSAVKAPKAQTISREAFTPDELRLIGENATGWMRHLFMVGLCTGLREGDICLLEVRDIRLDQGEIVRRTRKTGSTVHIPIMPSLRETLETALSSTTGTYLHEGLARRYLSSRTSIGREIGAFLRGIGIETTRSVANRNRPAVVKDVHSLRHTFCYLAAMHGMPLPVVQSIVGHMDASMTRAYMDHATADARRQAIRQIPNYLIG